MTFKSLAAATCVAALAAAASTSAYAQAAAPAAAIKHGPPVPGVCILSGDAIVQGSALGKFIMGRLNELKTQVEAELGAEKTAIDNEAKALDAQRATLDQAAFEKRAGDLNARASVFQRKVELRSREMQLTSDKALGRLDRETKPVLDQVYQQKQCSLLIQAGALLMFNPAMDVTPPVMAGLNAKIQRFDINRERLDQQPPAAAK
ncbi:OmpH family outer membrane protein [Phenylobacterium sp.]|jgi:outer membrane protein|uniref:OmpH family outer membrane protein n=1 Tax=Phenylobacterium sp. TaxID=1871053 RepID=UPI002F40A4AB